MGRFNILVKALILLALAGIAIGLVKIFPTRACFGLDHFQRIIDQAGLMGPALLVIFCAVGTCFFVPVTVFVGIATAMFGPYLGFACVCPGAIAGAVISYLIARRLGRQFVYPLIGDRLGNYDGMIERNGFQAVLFLRLMFVPFWAVNYGAGLTKVRFRDYLFATVLGEAATIFLTTFFIGEIREAWISGDRGLLFFTKMALSIGFLVALWIIARLLQRKYESRLAPSLIDSHRPPGDLSQ